jgi:hypothetical protein
MGIEPKHQRLSGKLAKVMNTEAVINIVHNILGTAK